MCIFLMNRTNITYDIIKIVVVIEPTYVARLNEEKYVYNFLRKLVDNYRYDYDYHYYHHVLVDIPQDIYDQVIDIDPTLIKYIPKENKTLELCRKVMTHDVTLIEYVDSKFITHDDILKTINIDGEYIKYIPTDVIFDDSIYKLAVANNYKAIKYVPPQNIDLDLIKIAHDKTTISSVKNAKVK